MAAQEEPELGRYPDGTTCLPAWKEPLPLNKMPQMVDDNMRASIMFT